jgi:lysozyme
MGTGTMVNLEALRQRLIREEGLRLRVYDDATGQELRPGMTLVGTPTIGVGRNLSDGGITREEAIYLLDRNIDQVIQFLSLRCRPWFSGLDQVRQQVCCDMAFNLGGPGFLGFHDLIRHLSRGEFREAAAAGRASQWYRQVGARGDELMTMLESGCE